MALIDRDTVAGAVRFHFEAKQCDIKAIIGSEITIGGPNGPGLPLVPLNLKPNRVWRLRLLWESRWT